MSIAVLGAGAFGTSLAISLAANGPVTLWARDADAVAEMQKSRTNETRLPGVQLPPNITISAELETVSTAHTLLLAVPAQTLRQFTSEHQNLFANKALVAACKGIDMASGLGPTGVLSETVPSATPAILTGPSFAADIARGLPTALTLACADEATGQRLQDALSTPNLRLYRSADVVGAELGGALKNVMAIACGVAIGAGFGDSARAALMTRGFAEMQRLAGEMGANPETLTGLSGLGDLALTCGSDLSRNFRHGIAIGRGDAIDPTITVEGVATAKAVSNLAQSRHLDLPICEMVTRLTGGELTPTQALAHLFARPLKEE